MRVTPKRHATISFRDGFQVCYLLQPGELPLARQSTSATSTQIETGGHAVTISEAIARFVCFVMFHRLIVLHKRAQLGEFDTIFDEEQSK